MDKGVSSIFARKYIRSISKESRPFFTFGHPVGFCYEYNDRPVWIDF
jgi:hypothetical protein